MKKKKLNWVNLVKLILLAIGMLWLTIDFITVMASIIKGTTIGFTYIGFGLEVIIILFTTIIFDDLFGE